MSTSPQPQFNDEQLAQLDARIKEQKELEKRLALEHEPIRSIYKWDAPERVFVPKDRRWYVIVAAVSMFVIVISALTNNFGLIFAIVAFILYIYASNTIPPRIITQEVTNKGLKVDREFYQWRNIVSFWVTERENHLLLHFEIHLKEKDKLTNRLITLIGKGDAKIIVRSLVRYVDYLSASEIERNFISRIMEGKYHPLLEYIEGENIETKDPNDNPALLNAAAAKIEETPAK